MEWAAYAGMLGAKIGGKVALNACLPGLGSTIDFVEAATCFYNGDVCGGALSSLSGIVDIATLGLVGAAKEAVKESAKGAVVQSAKDTAKSAAKEASRKVGQDLGKQIAMGATKGGKDAAIKITKVAVESVSKQVTVKVGQQVGKELAKGVTTEAVEEVLQVGTKMTVKKVVQITVSVTVSDGGRKAAEDVGGKLIFETMKQNPKEIVFQLFKKAAKKAAEEGVMEHSLKFIVKDAGVSALKGTMRSFSGPR